MHVRDGRSEDVDGVARVWAAATAARDGRAEPAELSVARVPILQAMGEPGAVLVVACAPQIVAFAMAIPTPRSSVADVDVRFVGVAPERWRSGLGAQVLRELVARLEQRGHRSASLLVYVDNAPAIRLYERLGWSAVDEPPSVHPSSGRLEQRYRLDLGPADGKRSTRRLPSDDRSAAGP